MKKRYGKLVRDRIPELIRANGEVPTVRTMETDEFRRELLYKLIEEAEEVRRAGYDASDPEFMSQLSDLQEVYNAILTEFDIDEDVINDIRKSRLEERGGFENKVFLEAVQDA